MGGLIIDRIGSSLSLILLTLITLVAHFLFIVGISLNSFYFMAFARFIFGLAGENILAATSTFLTKIFRHK